MGIVCGALVQGGVPGHGGHSMVVEGTEGGSRPWRPGPGVRCDRYGHHIEGPSSARQVDGRSVPTDDLRSQGHS